MTGDAPADRVDKWLWRARFFKTRTGAARAVSEGLRINGQRTDKPAAVVRPGDVLTLVVAGRARVIEIVSLGERRGPAPEAQALYVDLSEPLSDPAAGSPAPAARPDSRDRRALAALRRGEGS